MYIKKNGSDLNYKKFDLGIEDLAQKPENNDVQM